jgi:hypothetical protein
MFGYSAIDGDEMMSKKRRLKGHPQAAGGEHGNESEGNVKL